MPSREVKTKFFDYHQNNSGGSFVHDENRGIGYTVIVEATSADDANKRAERIGLYFDGDGDCSCCGNRWSDKWRNEDGKESPCIYDTDVSEGFYSVDENGFSTMWGLKSYIHYMDGTVKEVVEKKMKRKK